MHAWEALGKATGLDHNTWRCPRKTRRSRFRDVVAQPRKITYPAPTMVRAGEREGLLQRRLHQCA